MCSTIARSWLMNSSARPSSFCRSCSRLTICALTETSSARDRLVADDQVGLGGQRAGDADALALAAGELVRPAAHRVARQAHRVHQLARRASSRSAAFLARPKLRIGSARMSRTRMRGLSERTGPGTPPACAGASGAACPPACRRCAVPSSTTWPAGDRRTGAGSPCRRWTCRSRIRRPAPASRPSRCRRRRRPPRRRSPWCRRGSRRGSGSAS